MYQVQLYEDFAKSQVKNGLDESVSHFDDDDSETQQSWFSLDRSIDCFHSRGQQPCKFIGTKESFYVRKEFNSNMSHKIGLVHQHGCRDVM